MDKQIQHDLLVKADSTNAGSPSSITGTDSKNMEFDTCMLPDRIDVGMGL